MPVVDQTDRAELRRLVDAERQALAEMQASVGKDGADVTKLDAWIKASGKMATAARVHFPALLDELDAADLASLPCKSGEGAGDREAIARIIDPHSFCDVPFTDEPVLLNMVEQSKGDALRKADRILALTPDATQTREAEFMRAVKDDLRGPDGEEYTDSGMEDAFFRWPVVERALRAALNARGGA